MPQTRVLLTGAGGFVGHHCLEHLLATTSWDIVCTDSFRHRGKTDRLTQVAGRTQVITHDLVAPFSHQMTERIGPIDYVIAMASESHVDRSIADPVPFVRNNMDVVLNTLELCRVLRPKAVVIVSTDEVYGPEPIVGGHPQPHVEWSPILPSNPYAASKAAQEAIAISYWRTYGVPVVIVNCMNLIGERQDPEKYVPMLIGKISKGEMVTIHGTQGDIGTRHYLHARNLADGIVHLLQWQRPAVYPAHQRRQEDRLAVRPDRFNIVGPDRVDNLELAVRIAGFMDRKLNYTLVDFHSARPGHDPHYGLDGAKMAKLGWKPPVPLWESLERTVAWTLAHPEWLA